MKKQLGICKTCKGPITRRSQDEICGKCYLQKRKDARAKKRKTQQKSEILTGNSGFNQKYLFKDDLSDFVPSGSL